MRTFPRPIDLAPPGALRYLASHDASRSRLSHALRPYHRISLIHAVRTRRYGVESSTYWKAAEQVEEFPAGSVALARSEVVELSGTETVIPGEWNCEALPVATGVPEHPTVLKIFTLVPEPAVPITFGALSLAGDAGLVEVIFGVAGARVSTVK